MSAYRSGLEQEAARQIAAAGIVVDYETFHLPYEVPASQHHYTPDFILPNGIVVETKGLFQTDDRRKHKLIHAAYPDLDIRLVFSRAASRIAKKSPTTYAMWADHAGIPWADKRIPPGWLTAPPNYASLKVLRTLGWAGRAPHNGN